MRRPKSIPKPPKKPTEERAPSPPAPAPVEAETPPMAKPRRRPPEKRQKAAPKPVSAPIEATQKIVVYVSPETRQRVEATVKARSAAFKLDFTTLTAVVVAAFEWFFEGDAPLQEAVSKLNRNQAGEPPYSKSISLEAPVAVAARFAEIPRGQRARIADAVIATWLSEGLSNL